MNFAGINLSNYMKGNSFGTEQQNALQDAATLADKMSYQTFGKAAQTKINNESNLNIAKQYKKAGAAIQGIMGPANTMAGIADIGTSLMSTDFSNFGGGGSNVEMYNHTNPVNVGGTSYPMMDIDDYNFDSRFDY